MIIDLNIILYLKTFKENNIDDIINFHHKSVEGDVREALQEMYDQGIIEVYDDLVFLK